MSTYKLLMLALCAAGAVRALPCEQNASCRDCVTDSDVCVWCTADNHNATKPRCTSKELASADWCPEPAQHRPVPAVEARAGTEQAHIQPQQYTLTLLPGEPVNFTFTLNTTAVDYPVDVYFLVGLDGYNYQWYRANVIINTLKTITKDISYGFGTFIDKNNLPFCNNPDECHSFKHLLTLTSNYTELLQMVLKSPRGDIISSFPKSGFDGVAQAIACRKIGWRDGSVKIVVYSSAYNISVAGTGKKADITKQYDGKCHTDADGVYTKELEMDYPSVDMINKLATDNNVEILFSYGLYYNDSIYDDIAHKISGSPVLYGNHFDNRDLLLNILTAITERMYKPIPKVQYKETEGRNFKITFNPDCTKNTDACKHVEDGLYNITASLTLLQYEGLDKYSIDITIPGVTDKLTLDIEVIKQCECESTIGNSARCDVDTLQNATSTSSETSYNIETVDHNGMTTTSEMPKKKKVGPNRSWSSVGRTSRRYWRRVTKYEVYEEGSDVPLVGGDGSSRGLGRPVGLPSPRDEPTDS